MRKIKLSTIVLAGIFGITIMSCQDTKKETTNVSVEPEMTAQPSDDSSNDANSREVLNHYLTLKNALVATDEGAAQTAGNQLLTSLSKMDISSYSSDKQTAIKDIVADAKEHAEHIGKSEMEHQREHFKMLSTDMIDLVEITGTSTKLYQQHCPMYDGGSDWLSTKKEIKNPYFGSKMMNCGEVQKEF